MDVKMKEILTDLAIQIIQVSQNSMKDSIALDKRLGTLEREFKAEKERSDRMFEQFNLIKSSLALLNDAVSDLALKTLNEPGLFRGRIREIDEKLYPVKGR